MGWKYTNFEKIQVYKLDKNIKLINSKCGNSMNKKEKWEKFKKTGKIEDYLNYRNKEE